MSVTVLIIWVGEKRDWVKTKDYYPKSVTLQECCTFENSDYLTVLIIYVLVSHVPLLSLSINI